MPAPPASGPFLYRTALASGMTENALRGPRVQRLGHGVYAAADLRIGLVESIAGALLVLPSDAVVTGVTALHLYGVTIGDPLPVRAVTATRSQSRRAGVRLARVSVLPPRRRRLATASAAWLAACVELDLVEAVSAADWLVHLRLVTLSGLLQAADAATSRGCRRARRAAALAREGVESPRESRLRMMAVLAGLPDPRCNVTLGNDTYAIGRVDMLFDAFRVILEYDGDWHRTDRDQWNTDLDRNDAFADLGFLTLRVTSARMKRPREVVRRLHGLLVEHGYAGPAPTFGPQWCTLFEPLRRV